LMNASDHGFGRRDPRIFFMSLLVVFLPSLPEVSRRNRPTGLWIEYLFESSIT
jgi:hypothetical protein